MSNQPVVTLNIASAIPVLDGLMLYALADGTEGSQKIDGIEGFFKFQVTATNTATGARTKQKFALHGRLIASKGVGIDHQFVLDKIVGTVKAFLASESKIITGDLAPGVWMTRAIWRYIFAAGTRASNFANGVGIFSQPQETNFIIGEDPIEKLLEAKGTYTLAIANDRLVKYYLGEEYPVWGATPDNEDAEDKKWTPCKKKLTPANVNECLEHFLKFISSENEVIEAFTADKFDDLVDFVQSRLALDKVEEPAIQETVAAPQPNAEAPAEKPGLLRRLVSPLLGGGD